MICNQLTKFNKIIDFILFFIYLWLINNFHKYYTYTLTIGWLCIVL